jgi:tetratricopeptide (TPR) repeat protein
MDIISILAIIVSVLFGLLSIAFAIKEGKRAKRAEQKIVDLEQAMISYKYMKVKAFDYYSKGNYEDSLDVFKKYLSNNKDEKAWNEIIGQIFKKETEKMYSGVFSFNEGPLPSISLLVQAYISLEDKFNNSSPYPALLKSLINDYTKVFDRNKIPHEFFIALFDKDWTKAKKLLPEITMLKDEEVNTSFKDFIFKYLNKKLGITDNSFVDDIPF